MVRTPIDSLTDFFNLSQLAIHFWPGAALTFVGPCSVLFFLIDTLDRSHIAMFRYLPGIILVQLVTLALLWVNLDASMVDLLSRVGLPAVLLSVVTALWFAAISRSETQREHAALIEQHFKEREKLTQALERSRSDVLQKASADHAKFVERASSEREKLVRETHQDLVKAERRASRTANMKVGAAFTLVTVAGVGLLFVQFMTLGLLTITGASGALGGYLLRWRQTRHVMQVASDATRLPPSGSSDSNLKSEKRPAIIYEGESSQKDKTDP